MINVIILKNGKDNAEIEKIKQRSKSRLSEIEDKVKGIIEKVRLEGDKALMEYSRLFDNVILKENQLIVSKEEIKEAYSLVDKNQIDAIKKAIVNVRKFAEVQMPVSFSKEIAEGVECGVMLRPIEKVGCYIPAGRYPLPSTTYMTIIPAKTAGVKEIIVATPPQKNGKANPAVIVAADICGASKIVKIGGAQAIAALAYGTNSVPKVDKIVGPGNIYVAAAKKLVFGDVGIDMLAGPSEILIIASEKANPIFVAADMLAQAEHDPLATALLITPSMALAEEVRLQIESQIEKLSSAEIIRKSFGNFSCIILVKSVDEAIELSNKFSPEHLEIVGYDEKILERITNAGSVFFGDYSCEAAGDYCSGTNHVLPTAGNSRFRAGLSVYDFMKMITCQKLTKKGLNSLKDTIVTLGKMENLPGHYNSALKRFEDIKR